MKRTEVTEIHLVCCPCGNIHAQFSDGYGPIAHTILSPTEATDLAASLTGFVATIRKAKGRLTPTSECKGRG